MKRDLYLKIYVLSLNFLNRKRELKKKIDIEKR